MKVLISKHRTEALPSQGRNADSISAGGATQFLVSGLPYRATEIGGEGEEFEIIKFVGMKSNPVGCVFEDANGDLVIVGLEDLVLVD